MGVAAEVEAEQLPCPMRGDDHVAGRDVAMDHLHTGVQESERLCHLQQSILHLNGVQVMLLQEKSEVNTISLQKANSICMHIYMYIKGQVHTANT